ncbi:MAG: TonB-dependent receptor plug domain-containing protein, partial [Candidatus Omnitrophota bacterium]
MKRVSLIGVVLMVGVLSASFNGIVLAEDNGVDLEKIVVTPYRYTESLANTPASVSVIDSDQISKSNVSTTVDLLSELSGVVVKDWTGNGSKAAVDIRGFGEQSALNTLVLVDGRRVNEIDLSGVSWRQIPLEQIERIEVLKGGFGSVLYGDNAVSGVINIITKRGADKPVSVEVTGEYGSYDTNKENIIISGTIKKI